MELTLNDQRKINATFVLTILVSVLFSFSVFAIQRWASTVESQMETGRREYNDLLSKTVKIETIYHETSRRLERMELKIDELAERTNGRK